mgnify:CR=1 FL=1
MRTLFTKSFLSSWSATQMDGTKQDSPGKEITPVRRTMRPEALSALDPLYSDSNVTER